MLLNNFECTSVDNPWNYMFDDLVRAMNNWGTRVHSADTRWPKKLVPLAIGLSRPSHPEENATTTEQMCQRMTMIHLVSKSVKTIRSLVGPNNSDNQATRTHKLRLLMLMCAMCVQWLCGCGALTVTHWLCCYEIDDNSMWREKTYLKLLSLFVDVLSIRLPALAVESSRIHAKQKIARAVEHVCVLRRLQP